MTSTVQSECFTTELYSYATLHYAKICFWRKVLENRKLLKNFYTGLIHFNWLISASFSLVFFVSTNNFMFSKSWRRPNSNPGPLVSEATVLSALLITSFTFSTKFLYYYLIRTQVLHQSIAVSFLFIEASKKINNPLWQWFNGQCAEL